MLKSIDRDQSFLLGANALYLNRFNFLIQYGATPPGCRGHLRGLDSDDFHSFDKLRSFICWPGLIDDRIEDPFEPFAKFPQHNEELKALIKSDADVARVALKDLAFDRSELERIEQANKDGMDRLDWMRPICRWSPCEVIWTARHIVVDYLSEGAGADAVDITNLNGISEAPAKVDWMLAAESLSEWKRTPARNGPAIKEAVRRVVDGDEANAHASALRLVRELGWGPRGSAKKGQIVAASENAAKDAIYLPASKILKSLEDNGLFQK
ncbi:hypothetical protein SAMN04488030_2610 [Aliiroseovarius halocynthiae]|uniref:Uncharacterized protein n=1 Tax=Aliiroseovarius halocynthiae TaxID=985055 RepID=A0A545SPV9_9RHOB|nr:hypothetical protein [Aliiroseovarius halocynthiae]TQV67019.1 hypothetical protein FIL88_10540 [Aliiroseovarius halocynthiae]SMR82263.1 hypothetical protein SAMN04488030_2610 [Aliiroseovarius halocynthiae]